MGAFASEAEDTIQGVIDKQSPCAQVIDHIHVEVCCEGISRSRNGKVGRDGGFRRCKKSCTC